jgi:hypothetical protein
LKEVEIKRINALELLKKAIENILGIMPRRPAGWVAFTG